MYSTPGVYNVLDNWGAGFGMVANDSSLGTAQNNAKALAATISAAVQGCNPPTDPSYGGIVLIPANNEVPPPVGTSGAGNGAIYYVSSSSETETELVSITCQFAIKIMGMGDATRLFMIKDSDVNNAIPMFSIANAGSGGDVDVGGITFEDLWFEYDSALFGNCSAVSSTDSQNVRLNRCVLVNVAQGISIVNTSQFSMFDCTGLFDTDVAGTMLTISDDGTPGTGSFYAYVANCQFRVGEGVGTGITVGLSLGACDQLRVVDCHFDGFSTGIVFNPSFSTQDLSFTNVTLVGTGMQISMMPTAGNKIQGVCFTNCSFNNNSAEGASGAGLSAVVVDSGAGHNSTVDGVRFVSCVCVGNPAAGLELRNGRNFEIIGGLYAGNSQFTVGSTGSAAIWLNGTGTNIRIVGVSCVPAAFGVATFQPYGIEIGAWTDVFISDCDTTGYGTGDAITPFKFATPGSGLEIVNCAGYNDQTTILTFVVPNGTPFSSATLKYFGPVVFYASGTGISEIEINGTNTNLKSGTFMLPAGGTGTATITYSAGTLAVVFVGM
jgi:hypothetical protein